MAKLDVPKKRVKHPPVADRSKTRALKTRGAEVSAMEKRLIRDTVKRIVRIDREAFQELEKY